MAFFPPLDASAVRELLDRYAYASERFQVTYADPNERPDLLARAGLSREELGQGVLHVVLGGESVQVREVTEEKVTNLEHAIRQQVGQADRASDLSDIV